MGDYLRPVELDDALHALAGGPWVLLAGGTDFYPARVGRPLDLEPVLDVSAIESLRGVGDAGDHWRVGALTTWSDLLATPLPPCFDACKQAARAVGGVQVQNTGTLVGNLCNASPAADGTPNLLSLEAQVELASTRGLRHLPVAEFVLGNRQTARADDEMVTCLRIPKLPDTARSVFLKLGARRYLVISIAMVSAILVPDTDGRVSAARIAVGACSEVPRRLHALEQALAGQALDPHLPALVSAEHLAPLSPIADVRGSADYRRDAALTLVRRALATLAGNPA